MEGRHHHPLTGKRELTFLWPILKKGRTKQPALPCREQERDLRRVAPALPVFIGPPNFRAVRQYSDAQRLAQPMLVGRREWLAAHNEGATAARAVVGHPNLDLREPERRHRLLTGGERARLVGADNGNGAEGLDRG